MIPVTVMPTKLKIDVAVFQTKWLSNKTTSTREASSMDNRTRPGDTANGISQKGRSIHNLGLDPPMSMPSPSVSRIASRDISRGSARHRSAVKKNKNLAAR
jgi:hypothetical protein